MWIDTHTHLLHARFAEGEGKDPPRDPAWLVKEAHDAGVRQMVTIACTRLEWEPSIKLTETYESVFFAAGIHPQDVENEPLVTVDELVALAAHPRMVGIGETGLDYFYEKSPRTRQRQSFERHMDAARIAGVPVVIHTRDAETDTVDMLKAFCGVPFIFHCFTGSDALADACIECGGMISFSGILTFKKADALRAIAARMPRDRVLLETDAPYLAPEPLRGRMNAPHLLPYTASVLAEVWQESPSMVEETTTANARRVFSRLPDNPHRF